MSMYSDFLEYSDDLGILHDNKVGRISGNGAIYTSEELLCYLDGGMVPPPKKSMAMSHLVDSEGLFFRHPTKRNDLDSTDNLVGFGVWAFVCPEGKEYVSRILRYGAKNFYSWNQPEPSKWTFRSFLGRQWQVMVHLRLSIDEWVSPIGLLWWSVAVLSSLFSKEQDSYRLSRCLVRVGEKKSTVCRTVGSVWRLVNRLRGVTIKEINEAYYGDKNHPLAVYSVD